MTTILKNEWRHLLNITGPKVDGWIWDHAVGFQDPTLYLLPHTSRCQHADVGRKATFLR